MVRVFLSFLIKSFIRENFPKIRKDRNSLQRCFIKIDILKNFTKFWGKRLGQGLLSDKVQTCNFIKKEALVLVLSCEFCEIFKNTIFTEHLRMTASGKRDKNELISFYQFLFDGNSSYSKIRFKEDIFQSYFVSDWWEVTLEQQF